MKNWDGTKEKVFGLQFANLIFIQDEDYYGGNNILDIDQVGEKVVKENQRLIIDAFNTIQKCDKLPSTLLAENEELLEFISNAFDGGMHDGEDIRYWKKEANELINKITK